MILLAVVLKGVLISLLLDTSHQQDFENTEDWAYKSTSTVKLRE